MNKYDKKHIANVRGYQRRIDSIYKKAVEQISMRSAGLDAPDGYIFTFDDFPALRKQIDALISKMQSDIEFTVTDGVRAEWDLANAKNDALVGTLPDALSQLAKYHRTHEDALSAFLGRKHGGLGLSENVWKYATQFKDEIEMGLDVGIRDGLDAASMARQLKQYLQFPDMLFRRVRDEHGVLHLSQRAAAFHPGQGVYRSSYKNARRLAATETNMAYRTSDHERWQDLDFVVGIEIHLSNNHTCLNNKGKPVPFFDICDELQGKYPKEFKFVGWHPHCRCIATPIMKTKAELDADDERLKRGEEPSNPGTSENAVTDMPDGWKQWMEDNAERLENAKSMPYFIRDNVALINGAEPTIPVIHADEPRQLTALEIAEQRHAQRDDDAIIERWQTRQVWNLMDDLNAGLLPQASQGAIDIIKDSIALGDYDDAQRRISMLQAAVRRHIARTAEREAAIRTAWLERNATDNLGDVIATVERMKVDSKEVGLLSKSPSSEDVIKHLGGGDKTRGSCSSQAYAYIGRRGGLDVTDYRGGDSMNFFANRGNIMSIAKDAGGLVEQNISDFTSAKNLFKTVEEGKEYYFAISEHAAVVRKVNGVMQYLELQSPLENGWKTLDDNVLKWRFKAKRSRSVRGSKYGLDACLIEASKLQKDKGYRKLLSYINTDAAKQLKGAGGSIK